MLLGDGSAFLMVGTASGLLDKEPSELGNQHLLSLRSLERQICEKLNGERVIQAPQMRLLRVTAECCEIMNGLLFTQYVDSSKNILANPE